MGGYTDLGDPVLGPASRRQRADLVLLTLLALFAVGIVIWNLDILAKVTGFIGLGFIAAALYFERMPRALRFALVFTGILTIAVGKWFNF